MDYHTLNCWDTIKPLCPLGAERRKQVSGWHRVKEKRVSVLTAGTIGNQQGAFGTFNDYKGVPKSSDMVKV